MRSKVTVVGAGNVGATTAQRIHQLGYADVVIVDIVEDLPQGKSLDMLESGPVLGTDALITGSNGYEETANSDVVVITAGIARRPGMSRDDLLLTNMRITTSVTEQVVKHSPNCIIIPVTNPLDAMVQNIYEVSGFPRERVFGMAGVLDTARFRTFIAQEMDVSVEDVQAYVLGGHGDDMVPLVRYTTVGGIPISELMAEEKVDQLVRRTRQGGGEIVQLLKEGSAYYAPSAAITQMVEAVLLDKKRILPACAYLQGEYGIDGLCVGVPVKLGAGGMEQVIEIRLTPEEQAALQSSAASVKDDAVSTLLPDEELFLHACARKEVVLSSQIEGTQSSLSELLRFELEDAPGAPLADVVEVSSYVATLEHGLRRLGSGRAVWVDA